METISDKGELVFLYQLIQGRSDTSHACHIAATVGIPPHIIQRAEQVMCTLWIITFFFFFENILRRIIMYMSYIVGVKADSL